MVKKKISKHIQKVKIPRRRKTPEVVERITNETVAQHREQILAGGRKFKYPVQYARHRLVINTIIISVLAIIVFVAVVWWQLYPAQNTSSFFYRITQLVPLPVATVDGQHAAYSNYLMEYRSSIHWLQTKSRNFKLNSPDGQRQSNHIKRQALDSAIETAYAQKVAHDRDISISEKEIDDFITSTLEEGERKLSKESYQAVLSDSYGVSEAEYRSIVQWALLKQKVAFAIDRDAREKIEHIQQELKKGVSFEKLAQKYSDDTTKNNKGDVGFVPKNNRDNGLARHALKLKKDQVSDIIEAKDAYYLIKLLDTSETQVRYALIKVELKKFNKDLDQLKKQDKVDEFIVISKADE